MTDRFDLEQAISNIFTAVTDLDLVIEAISDNKMSIDEMMNALTGISKMLELKADKAMNVMTELIHNKKM